MQYLEAGPVHNIRNVKQNIHNDTYVHSMYINTSLKLNCTPERMTESKAVRGIARTDSNVDIIDIYSSL